MGLFDSLASKAMGSLLGGQDANNPDLGALISGVMSGKVDLAATLGEAMNSMGGIEGIQQKFQQSGLGEQFSSWVGKGENLPVTADDLKNALGNQPEMAKAASSLGIDLNSILPMLATILPGLIDKLTPKGEVDPSTAAGPGLQDALAGLLKGGNLADLLGSGASGGLGGLLGGLLGGGKA
jgi:uncharacterized protein YidB (DUF937 family)